MTEANYKADAGNLESVGIWLINQESAAERRRIMIEQLDRMGLPFRLFDGIDGAINRETLQKKVDQAAYERNMGGPMLPGKIGVYASHLGVWNEFLASEYPVALILEDDVVFHDDFIEALNAALSIQDCWDLIRFNSVRAKGPVTQTVVGKYRLNAYIGPFTGNATYLIKRDTAAKLLPGLWPQTRALDHELNRFFHHDYRQMGLEPWASHLDDGGVSTITGENHNLLHKPSGIKRLPHYRLKAMNYIRRARWLYQRNMLSLTRKY